MKPNLLFPLALPMPGRCLYPGGYGLSNARRVFSLLGLLLLLNQTASWGQCFQNILDATAYRLYPVGSNPFSVAVGDLNGDGKSDLVTANLFANTVSVLLGDGAGGFGPRADFAVGQTPTFVAVGDLNGDGKPDLVTANFSASTVSVLLGAGAGSYATFTKPTSFTVGSGPYSVVVRDLNGDGKLDLVTANYNTSTVSVLLGDGAGGFGNRADFGVSFRPSSVAVGDVNGDGKLDLVTSNAGANAVSVLLGNGAGGFGPSADFGVGLAPASVAVVDVNGDGKLDLVTANPGAEDLVVDNVSVLLGNGLGSFGSRTDIAVGIDPLKVAVGDLNGDGKPDLVTANFDDNTVTVLYNCTNVPLFLSTLASPNPVCAGASLALSATVTGGSAPYSFTWAAPAGITLSATSTSAVSASVGAGVSGVQTFTLTAAASGGTPSSTSLVSVTVNAAPTNPSLSSGTLTCAQTSVTLTASSTGGSSYTLNGGTGSQTNATGRFVVSSPGNYTAIIGNANGCSAVATSSVVSNTALPDANFTGLAPAYCRTNGPVSLTPTTPGGSFSGPGISGTTFTPSGAGSGGTITYSVTGVNACVNSTTQSVAVSTVIALSLTNDGPLNCGKTTATLTATPAGQGTYVFSQPAASQGSNTATVSQTGVYSVTFTSTGGCTGTASTTVIASQSPPTPTVATQSTPNGLAVQVSGGVSYERVKLIDRVNGYEIRQTEQNQTGYFVIPQPGPYSITVVAANGCRATVTGTF